MLADQTSHLPAEVAADVRRVNAAYDKAITAIRSAWWGSEETISGLTGMRGPIDAWADRGTKAAATPTGVPGTAGWPGWVAAGQVFLDGIAKLQNQGTSDKLDAITAQAMDLPKTTAVAAGKAVAATAKVTVKAASVAMDVGAATATAGAGFLGGLAGATFLVENFVYIAGGLLAYKLFIKKKKR